MCLSGDFEILQKSLKSKKMTPFTIRMQACKNVRQRRDSVDPSRAFLNEIRLKRYQMKADEFFCNMISK